MGSYLIKTLGCKANLYDSQLIEAELKRRGWVRWNPAEPAPGGPLLCVVNSCTVTDEADRQTRKLAARLFREHPEARIVVTGCGAEIDPERLASSPGIHYLIGNRDKPRLVELILEKLQSAPGGTPEGAGAQVLGAPVGYAEMLSRHPMDREWPLVESAFAAPPVHSGEDPGRTRAFLKIQEGCNSFCTYCVIPYGRGPSRSLRPEEAVAQVRQLVAQGVRELVITGTNIGDYGTDWSERPLLEELLELIFEQTELERLRVSSLDPTEITPSLVALMEREKRFCPHFHVSLQSPDSRILRLMKRRYGFEEVRECLGRIARIPAPPGGVFVGMDLITGFPGESAEDFERTCEVLEALPWTRLHVFPYSERAGTPAGRLPGSVPREERLSRARRLNDLSLRRMTSLHEKLVGARLDSVLLERPRGKEVSGYTSNYLRVILPTIRGGAANPLLRNQLVSVKAKQIRVSRASGEVFFEADWLDD
ncbi:MAG: tRNA (N(6)-L-threonylcarbamoyladenosine(37)-C(2))-methylthiotransferase MtaB [Oligoflexia bacterium]|nr:tRNA (N(6)-L-threonylcarbamoyladenosine(37)-C(2))-methylthiotransferase MtaB [Oligoflexia bacterium]